MFSRLSLKAKLLAAFGVVTVLFIAVGVNGIWALYKVDKLYSHVAEDNVPMLLALGEIESSTTVLEVMAYKMGDSPNGVSALLPQIEQKIKASSAKIQENLTKIDQRCITESEKALCQETRESAEGVMALTAKALEYTKAGHPDDLKKRAEILSADFELASMRFHVAIDKQGDAVGAEEVAYNDKANKAADLAYKSVPAGLVIGVLLAFALGLLISRALAQALTDIAQRLTSGAEHVTSASGEISKSSGQLSSSSTQQAAALAETVSALEEIGAMVGRNAENSQKSVEISKESQSAAQAGTEAVSEMLHSMDDINRSNSDIEARIAESNREISGIITVINEIGTKTKVINDIVFQTKLLSFNASVEAARAGEHGKGFAVVAEEVGNLATMSGNAAKEISDLLDGSIHKVEQIVNNTKQQVEQLMQSGRIKVEAGSATAKRCADTLNELAQKASRAFEMASEIATASQEQAQGIREINKAMTQLDQVTQQNAQASQNASHVSERLKKQTHELEQIVGLLNQTIFGGGTSPLVIEKPVEAKVKKVSPKVEEKKKEAKVVPMPVPQKAAAAPAVTEAPKKAAGSDLTLPSESDPRFKDF